MTDNGTIWAGDSMRDNSSEINRSGSIPEINVEPYKNGSHIVTPEDPLPESKKERRDGPGGE